MKKYLLCSFPLFICTIFLGGCFDEAKPVRTAAVECDTITTAEFASTYRARQIGHCSSEGCSFDVSGSRLEFYAGLKVIKFGGRIYNVPIAPVMSGKGMLLPVSLVESLPAVILSRKNIRPATMQVVIDAGHGGKDPGANGGGVLEKSITLDVAKRLQRILSSSGMQVVMTRSNDRFLELVDRCSVANGCPGAVFVSIHVNSEDGGSAKGVETFFIAERISDSRRAKLAVSRYHIKGQSGVRGEYNAAMQMSSHYRRESEVLAGMVQQQLAAIPGIIDRGVKEDNFAVLRESFFGPAVLVEVGFVSNAQERARLSSTSHREKLAQAIARGLQGYAAARR